MAILGGDNAVYSGLVILCKVCGNKQVERISVDLNQYANTIYVHLICHDRQITLDFRNAAIDAYAKDRRIDFITALRYRVQSKLDSISFPSWVAPVASRITPIKSSKNIYYGEKLTKPFVDTPKVEKETKAPISPPAPPDVRRRIIFDDDDE